MSADNYFLVRRHLDGGFALAQGFASDTDGNGDERDPEVRPGATRYATIAEALAAGLAEYAEYGVSVHPECTRSLGMGSPTVHDPMCPRFGTCECVGLAESDYLVEEFHDYECPKSRLCVCELIARVRADEAPKAVTRWIERGAGYDDWMKIWQVRDYAEELEAKTRTTTLDEALSAIELLLSEPLPKIERGGPAFIRKSVAMDAIDALRGDS